MSSINFATREISCKVVYYGPGLSGKTTNLQVIHQKMPSDKRTDMVSLATEGDRTLFFDFLPLNLGDIKGFKTRFQLYTVPGQVYYNSTRKLVLRGVDGIVFVADSQRSRQAENLESLQNLRQNLQDYGMDLDDMPFVLQYNKRDMENVFTLEEMNAELNLRNVPFFPATAHNGKGVVTTLKTIAMLVIEKFNVKQGFLRKAAESVNNTGVHDVSLTKEGVSVSQAAPAQPAAPAAPAAATPFKMPSFAAKPPVGAMPSSGGSPFQKPVSSPFGRPRAVPQPPRMPTFGRVVDKGNAEVSDDEIELRPYVPKKK
ncbi:MAG: GTPase domain-containing protein [Fibrobacter sp.]|nr:GTPase domain-containing protein [Fibrobacter sp.]MBQ9226365.1 GTPase domain-containing protein [Fibrobacter sp.]